MGTKEVTFSDFSGHLLNGTDEPVQLVVLEHPELPAGPVQLEALSDEVAPAVEAALAVAIFELHEPGAAPRRVVVEASDFDALATHQPMRDVLKAAQPVKRRRPATTASPRRAQGSSYATLEQAGTPHRGKVTAEEARLVREHLDEINARLARHGMRQINPKDPTEAERYGFPASPPGAKNQ